MNTMKRLLMISALMVVSSSCFAEMRLKLVNERADKKLTVHFQEGYLAGAAGTLKDASEEIEPGATETVVVGDNWRDQHVTITWKDGEMVVDTDTVHFDKDKTDEELISTSADVAGRDVAD